MGNQSNIYIDITSRSPEVTGSCIKIVAHIAKGITKKILLDKGFFQEAPYNHLNSVEDTDYSDIDYVFLSHNHIDHSGLLPTLYTHKYKGSVFCSCQTEKILHIALNNVAKIMETEAKELNICKSVPNKAKPLYTYEDVEKLRNHIIPIEYDKVVKVDKNFSFMFIHNPHLYGAASIFMSFKAPHEETVNFLYTGDYAKDNMLFNVLPFPTWLYTKKINIIQEATYGNITTSQVEEVFKNNIINACKDNKAILLPSFAIGRYQEAMYLVNLYKSLGFIPEDYPVYLDGKIPLEYNSVLFKDKTLKSDVKEVLKKYPFIQILNDPITREKILRMPRRCIVITTSGMVSNGFSNEYVRYWLNRKNVLIHLLGYMSEGTIGRMLIESQKGDEICIKSEYIKKVADVAFTMELSRHAKQDQQIEYLKPFKYLKCHITTHGSKEAKKVYSECVEKEINPKSSIILEPDKTFRIGAYGLKKIF